MTGNQGASVRPVPRLVLVAACCILFPVPLLAQPALPAPLRDVGIDQKLDAQVPLDLGFRDDTGRTVKLADYFGSKPVILALVYYDCPMLCTQVLNGLAGSLKALTLNAGEEFLVLTVSFDPRETPELAAGKKKSYLAHYSRPGAAAGWHFLTGSESSIESLTRAVGFRYRYDAEKAQYAHASGIMVLTPQGRLSRYFYGIEYAPRDLRLGLVEASNGRIGSPVDQLLLFCYHYDPATGKYGPVVMNFVRLGGAATVLTLGTFLVLFLRRDARRSHSDIKPRI
jgi:protein SCO1/2